MAILADLGLCAGCEHLRRVRSARGSEFVLCARSALDPSFPKYPRLPVRQCKGYVPCVNHRTLQTQGIRLHVAEQGEGPLVLLLHGFPESWFSWRHQLPALAAAGYRVVAPDQRGYADSDRPEAIDAYDQVTLVDDMVGLLDALGEERAIVVGHDWGAPVAWHMALLHPERVRAVVGMSVPYGGRAQSPPLHKLEATFKDIFFYILYFQEPGVAEAELEADVRKSLRTFYYSASGEARAKVAFSPHPKSAKLLETMTDPTTLPPWLSEADLDYFTTQFERSGFRGPLNWYRNFDRTWERTAQLAGKKIEQPALFIAGERDPVMSWSKGALERMPGLIPNLRESLLLPDCGHWVQQERPEQVNAALLRFLAELGGA
jgi:pimeloyl-ACP methyl ester carboxylesterase